MTLSAVPSSKMEGARPLLARSSRREPRTALCVCCGPDTVGCADQHEGGSRVLPPPQGLALLVPRTAYACVSAITLSAVPSSEGEGEGPLPAGTRPARAAQHPCVCHSYGTVGCAEQREEGSRTPPCRV